MYLPFYKQFMICDRSRFKTAVDRIVAWDFDSVLPCHGTYIAQGGKEVPPLYSPRTARTGRCSTHSCRVVLQSPTQASSYRRQDLQRI